MRRGLATIATGLLALAACNQQTAQKPESNVAEPVKPPPSEVPPSVPPPATGPDAKTPLVEPKGAMDPKGIEAAGQVVQHFGALIEQNRFSEAAKLWSDADAALAFTKQLRPRTHLEIGDVGETDGAAGSIYTTVPVVFYTDSSRRRADVTLRRVNDVPGSTEAERRWHIERIDWKGGA